MIQIEHRSLSPFKEDLLAFTDVEVGRVIRILYILADLIGIAEVFLEDFIVIEALAAVIFFKETIFQFNIATQFFRKNITVHEITDANADTVDLIGIAGADTIFRRADFSIALDFFIFFVDADVIRHDDVCPRRNFQLADGYPF